MLTIQPFTNALATSETALSAILPNVIVDASSSSSSSWLCQLAVPTVLSIATRGGGEAFAPEATATAAVLDIARVRMRLEGLQVYATLSALLTNACLRLYSSVHETKSEEKRSTATSWAADLFFVCTVISVLSGSFTTIIFGLFSILSKTALGRGLDLEFLEFWKASAMIRESGFESFLCSLISFELSFVLSLFLKFKGRRRNLLLVLASVILLVSIRRWTSLLYLASKLLFPLRAEVEY